jgi:PBSX family phage terminase large subunit
VKFKILKEKMLPHQRRWWDLPNFVKLMVGGYGSGKTYIGALRSIYLSYVNSPHPGMYVSPSHNLGQKTIIITLKEVMNKAGMDYTFNQMKGEFIIDNWNGKIWIGSGDKPDSLRGPNLAWAGIDEPFIQKRDVFDQMLARVRHPDAEQREIFLTGTPEQLNWGFQLTNSDKIDIGTVTASTLDNPYLPDEYKTNLMAAYTPEQIEAYLHGKFVNLTQGRVYKEFDRDIHVIHRELEGWTISGAQDYNVDANTVVIFAHNKNEMHVFDEFRLKNSGTYDMAEAVKEKYPGINIYPDATGSARKTSASQSDHDIMRQNGFKVLTNKSNPHVKDRVNAVNKLLKDRRLTIENAPNLLMDFEQNVWRNNDIDKRDPEQTHASDAIGYAVSWLFPIIDRKVGYQSW